MFHGKLASDADSEVILFTKKNSSSKLNPRSLLEVVECESSDEDQVYETKSAFSALAKASDPAESIRNKSPVYRIEFDSSNKIELVLADELKEQSETLEKISFEKPNTIAIGSLNPIKCIQFELAQYFEIILFRKGSNY